MEGWLLVANRERHNTRTLTVLKRYSHNLSEEMLKALGNLIQDVFLGEFLILGLAESERRAVTTKVRYLFYISGEEYIKSIDFICILLAS
jgi:hypothetical protein